MQNRSIFLTALIASVFFFTYNAEAQVSLVFAPTNTSDPVYVEAFEATIERGRQITRFEGGVVVTQGGITLTSDYAEIQTVNPDSSDIQHVLVQGDVELTGETGFVEADEGIYLVQERVVELNGNVRVKAANFSLSGQLFVYNLDTGDSSLTGDSAADIKISE